MESLLYRLDAAFIIRVMNAGGGLLKKGCESYKIEMLGRSDTEEKKCFQ